MTEKDLTATCRRELQQGLAGALVLKHNDRMTSGIPDVSVSWKNATTWLEFKIHSVKWRPGQLETCVQLERQTQRCWIVVYDRWDTTIYRPSRWPVEVDCSVFFHSGELWGCGAVKLGGHNHKAIVQLVKETHV